MVKQTGAILSGNKCYFAVWAPEKTSMLLHIVSPAEQQIEMKKDNEGYFSAEIAGIHPGCRYYYMPDGEKDYADPASSFQPEGVHGSSEVFDHRFNWTDEQWKGIPLATYIIYEIHIGTFTAEGTFDTAISRLDDLVEMGINAVEIMPVSQFPGERNWGYDGVFPYATQNSYGGPEAFKRFVDACHNKGIAVILDVVYNHIGPEGNCLWAFGPYFTDKYGTPWGKAVNFDGPWSDGVRNYFCNNALYWLRYFHVDALRLDAIHQMYDFGATHFWEMLHDAVRKEGQKCGRHFYLIAESNLNNPKIIKHSESGGYGFHAQWLDDFHHSLYSFLAKRKDSYYVDFGSIDHVAKAYTDGFVLSGEYVQYRKRKYGRSSAGIFGDRFIVFNQNHDQVGNQVDGARLSVQLEFDALKIAAAALLLSPYIPMFFMGEDYGEDNPFYYFIDHTEEALIEAVRKGRKKEFELDNWNREPADPKDEKTFLASKLSWEKRRQGKYKLLSEWHKALLALRKTHPALANFNKNGVRVFVWHPDGLALHRKSEDERSELLIIFNLGTSNIQYTPLPYFIQWNKILDSCDFALDNGNTRFPPQISESHIDVPKCSVALYANTTAQTIK